MLLDAGDLGVRDLNGDGVSDAIVARIYVADDATVEELAAAANIAARLAFETVSMDLPLAFPISQYEESRGLGILVGRAATHARPGDIALRNLTDCENLARTLGLDRYKLSESSTHPPTPPGAPRSRMELGNFFCATRQLILGPEVRSRGVIDLAARIGLETTELNIPLSRVVREIEEGSPPPANSVVIGLSNPWVQQLIRSGKFSAPADAGCGFLAVVDGCVIIAGTDARGEAAAIEHAALRMPYLFSYGKGGRGIPSIEDEVRRYRPGAIPATELIFEDTRPLVWEVDVARQRRKSSLLPAVEPGIAVDIDLRLSEPQTVRRELVSEIRELLALAGADLQSSTIQVLSAHKQGFCWIDEILKPKLRQAARVHIRIRRLECKVDSVDTENRWLHELYPIDEILARDLDLPAERITFELTPVSAEHTYEVAAQDEEGRVVLNSFFDPTCVTRPLFDLFPDYAKATVATGWIRGSANRKVHLNERIPTDYETFWDDYQAHVLPRLSDYVLELHAGEPQPQSAPHFDELTVEVQLSEPDHSIGIDEERISTLEALHEDLYFETLLFFEVLGIATCGRPLRYPGRIIPRIHPSHVGPGRAHVRLTGYRVPFTCTTPFADQDPLVKMVTVNELGVTSVEILAGARFSWLLEGKADTPQPESPLRRSPIVQLDQPIAPAECERIIGALADFQEVRPFAAGRSWRGHTIWAMDVTAPFESRYVSQAKAAVTKPCLFITGRQHANEVSSTSHILRLVELLVTKPEYRQLLNRVNFLIQPITNPDGAALVGNLHEETPGFMLHAGYLGALGVDVTEGQWENAPKYPEARIRADLWRMWQPDIVLNPHGYPSHEWVQLFAGYTAWVKSKRVHARDWWIPRGWFIPRFDFIEDAGFPHHRELALLLCQRIAEAVDGAFGDINDRMYRRYAKYMGTPLELHKGVLIQSPACGSTPDPRAFGFMTRHPDITFLESLSEAPDEVASGEWLKKLVAVGLEVSLAHARLLADLPNGVVRTRWHEAGTEVLRISRTRPLPGQNDRL
jgi:hypothetical protein